MSSISALKAEGVNFIFLNFTEQQAEKNFIKVYDVSNRIFYRLGIYLSCFAWSIWYAGIYLSHTEVFWTALTVLIVVLLVPFIAVVALSFTERYSTLTHHLTAACNFAAASICIYVAVYLIKDITFLCAGVICISFFCYFILRIRFKFSLIITLSYAAIAQITVVTSGNFAVSEIYTSSSGIWLGFSIAMLAGYFFERTNRKLYVQNKLIEEQYLERDRSRQRQLEQAEEIRKAYKDLKSTQSQLIQSEKMASLGELTAGIAHEIQNPLNFVNNFSDVNTELIEELEQEAARGNIDEVKLIAAEIKENEQKINHHGQRADAIVKGMLQHSRSSSGIKEPTDINKLADEYLRLSYQGLRAKNPTFNATIKTDFDPSIGNINIIPQDIGRVLLNLYNNAFYACTERSRSAAPLPPEGEFQGSNYKHEPTVIVTTKKITPDLIPNFSGGGGGAVLISVKDNGSGIPQNIIDKIFQPFFTTKPTGQGTGLGLSLSYDIVKAQGGELKVESEEGKGAEFIILLFL